VTSIIDILDHVFKEPLEPSSKERGLALSVSSKIRKRFKSDFRMGYSEKLVLIRSSWESSSNLKRRG
jgi:hypothetical protein